MSADIEKMTKRKGSAKTWHGTEGETDVTAPGFTLETWAKDAGLDWTAHKQPLLTSLPANVTPESLAEQGIEVITIGEQQFIKVPDQIAVMRDTDARFLGYHSPDYNIVQPIDTLQQLDGLITIDDRFNWETAGSLDGGRKVFATAVFEDGKEFNVLGEQHTPYLLAATSFDGTMATTLAATLTRVVCSNTLRMALGSKSTGQVKLVHRSAYTEAVKKRMRDDLQGVIAGFKQYNALAEALAKVKVSEDAAKEFLEKLIFTPQLEEVETADGKKVKAWTKPSTRTKGLIDKIIASYETTLEEGTDKGTAWTMLNTVTRYADHDMGTRLTNARKLEGETSETVKQESVLFGAADRFKQTGLKALIDNYSIDTKKILQAA